jgi:ribonuclease Z
MAELVILGSSGWIPQDGRMTSSLALRLEEDLLIFDAGSGIGRLSREPFRRLVPAPGRPIHLFLTHLHFDHLVGLTFLPALWSNPTLVHVPDEEVTGAGPDAFDRLLGGPFFPLRFDELLPAISRETSRPGVTHIGGLQVEARREDHPGGSLAYRAGDLLAFVTDCTYDPSTADFAHGVQLLVHEAWTSESDDPGAARARMGGHSSAEEAARVAREAGVGELLLTHLPPTDDTYYADMLERARVIFPRTTLCVDGMTRQLR